MAGAFSSAFSDAFDIGTGAVVATSRKHRSLFRRKKKPGVIWLPGTEPAVVPETPPVASAIVLKFEVPAEPKTKPKPIVARLMATEVVEDTASIHATAIFVPVVADMLTRELSDAAHVLIKVTGIGYDQDDLEMLAIAMGDY